MMLPYLIVVLILAAAVAAAFYLAKRSMQDFQETPEPKNKYGVFLVRLPKAFDEHFLSELFTQFKATIIAFERLFKGEEHALVIYCPLSFEKQFPHLQLLELEDYSLMINSKNALAWDIVLKRKTTLKLHKKDEERDLDFLDTLDLGDADQVLYQIVAQPDDAKNNTDSLFQINMRIVVLAEDPLKRAKIAQRVDAAVNGTGLLTRKKNSHSSSRIIKDYRKRYFVPREVRQFKASPDQLISLLK